jgi:hypothetical protein
MGEARTSWETLRQTLEDVAAWEFPSSPWESAVCAELRDKTVLVVPRAPINQLNSMPLRPKECHANVRWYVKNDPYKETRAVTGWWLQWPDFVLHSVIEINGQLICITPSYFHETELHFIPDPKINWIETGEVYSAVRDGQVIRIGVRTFPSFTMARCAILRERLLAGIDPSSAIQFSEELMEKLKREHIDREE